MVEPNYSGMGASFVVDENEPETVPSMNEVVYQNGPDDLTHGQMLKLVETSGALNFWDDEEEDIYSDHEG